MAEHKRTLTVISRPGQNKYFIFHILFSTGTWGSVVVKELRY